MLFKASERTLKQIKEDKGLEQQIRECNRSKLSATGALKQSMKSHKKYGKQKQPQHQPAVHFDSRPLG